MKKPTKQLYTLWSYKRVYSVEFWWASTAACIWVRTTSMAYWYIQNKAWFYFTRLPFEWITDVMILKTNFSLDISNVHLSFFFAICIRRRNLPHIVNNWLRKKQKKISVIRSVCFRSFRRGNCSDLCCRKVLHIAETNTKKIAMRWFFHMEGK